MATHDDDFTIRSHEPFNGGPDLRAMVNSFITPTHLFFVRNHGAVPQIDPAAYRLSVGGLVTRPLVLSLTELADRFERVTVTSTLACAGQRRQEMSAVASIPGELPWGAEAVSTAEWSGWRLADVLLAGGLEPGAQHVAFEGLDDVERQSRRFKYGASIPLEKALGPEVLLVDTMNGEPLPPRHGYPLRVVVPGYIGARQVKWIAAIDVRESSSDNYFQAVAYRRYPRDMSAATHDPAKGVELTELEVNCLIAEPVEDAVVSEGHARVRGVAYSGGLATVARVEVSGDGGETWSEARLDEPVSTAAGHDPSARWTWRIFACDVEVMFGPDDTGQVIARAFDDFGAEQPADAESLWNFKGYMNNAWPRVTVRRR
ncbi:MAG TPA: molybdopterin-dependent oxidoreductase [Trueperaceae bacterium]|nr:molybdopterin-dependent oxidoreductase [Trueperaceae bacterium]